MTNDFTPEEIADMSNEELTAINKQKEIPEGYTEVELEFTDEELKTIMELAADLGMDLNTYINHALAKALESWKGEEDDNNP